MAESLSEEEKECADCAPDRSLPVRALRSRSLTRRKWPARKGTVFCSCQDRSVAAQGHSRVFGERILKPNSQNRSSD